MSQITVTDSDSGMETESHMFWVPFRRFYEIHPRRLAAALALLIFTVGAVAATGLVLVGVVGVIVGVIIGLVLGLLGIFGLDGWREQIREHRSAP